MKKYSTVIIFLAFCSCEMVIDVEVPYEGPQIAVHSFFSPDSLWSVVLTKSRFILDDGRNYPWTGTRHNLIDDADVEIYDGEELLDVLTYNNGIYISEGEKPRIGKEYTLKVSAPGFDAVYAKDKIPEPVKISSVVFRQEPFEDYYDSDNTYTATIRFNDPEGVKNYYVVNILAEYTVLEGGEGDPSYGGYRPSNRIDAVNFMSSDPSLVGSEDGYSYGRLLNFTDSFFDGKNGAEIKIGFYHHLTSADYLNVNYYIILYHVSYATHLYSVSAGVQSYGSGNPFSQPVQILSNVSNGMGIFGGLSHDIFKVEFKGKYTQ